MIARSLLGSAFVEHLLAEYYEFSPLVAADMAGDEHTREAVRSFVVRPLLAYLRLVDEFIRSGGVDPRRLRLIADIDLNEFVGVLRDEGIHLDAVEEAKVQWHRLVIGNPPLTPSARWNPAWAAAYLAEKASDGRRRLLFVEWALAEPIGVYWGWIETVMRVGTVGVDLKLEFVLTGLVVEGADAATGRGSIAQCTYPRPRTSISHRLDVSWGACCYRPTVACDSPMGGSGGGPTDT